jgi:hypothetical protein
VKWEDRALQRGAKFIGSELKNKIEGQLPKINIITRGGEKIGVDADNKPKIQKASLRDDRYDPLKQNCSSKMKLNYLRVYLLQK